MTNITVIRPFNIDNRLRNRMKHIRQLVSVWMIVAVVSMFSAPLMACEAAGHRCAMMSHAPKVAVAPAHMATHACCPKKGSEAPAPEKNSSCHEQAVVMPAECSTSTQCCDMGNTPAVSTVQAEPSKRSAPAIVSDAPPDPTLIAIRHVGSSDNIPRNPRPVFELKADLRV